MPSLSGPGRASQALNSSRLAPRNEGPVNSCKVARVDWLLPLEHGWRESARDTGVLVQPQFVWWACDD